jgi:OB-fold nucleic acid binding domain.
MWRKCVAGVFIVSLLLVVVPTFSEAIEQRKWKSSDEGVISYLDVGKYINQTKTVEGKIVKTYRYVKGDIIFLNFHDPHEGYFTAIIWKDDWGNFSFAPEDYYKGKEVRVTGKIVEHKTSPEIVVRNPSQIEVAYGG